MMKRLLSLLLAVCLCTLAGCHASDAENRFHLSEPPEAEASGITEAQNTTETTEAETLPLTPAYGESQLDTDPTYNYGNMQVDIPAGNYVPYDGSVLFQATWGGKVHMYIYNLDTGELSLPCKDATCDHLSMECPLGGAWGNLEACQGEVYAMNMSSSGTLLKLKNWKWERALAGGVSLFCHRGENLYVRTADGSLVAYENGSTKPRMLVEEFPYSGCVVIGNYLYAHEYTFGQVVRVDLTSKQPELEVVLENAFGYVDGTYIYYDNFADDHTLYRCDINGENPEKITDRTTMAVNFDNEYVYFRYVENDTIIGEDGHDLYRFPKDDPSKIEKIATLPEYIYRIYTVPGANLLFVDVCPVDDWDDWDQEKPSTIYVMNRDGRNPRLLSFPDT